MSIARTSAAALVATAPAPPAAAPEVVVKVHHFWPPTLPVPWCDRSARDLIARLEKK